MIVVKTCLLAIAKTFPIMLVNVWVMIYVKTFLIIYWKSLKKAGQVWREFMS